MSSAVAVYECILISASPSSESEPRLPDRTPRRSTSACNSLLVRVMRYGLGVVFFHDPGMYDSLTDVSAWCVGDLHGLC